MRSKSEATSDWLPNRARALEILKHPFDNIESNINYNKSTMPLDKHETMNDTIRRDTDYG